MNRSDPFFISLSKKQQRILLKKIEATAEDSEFNTVFLPPGHYEEAMQKIKGRVNRTD